MPEQSKTTKPTSHEAGSVEVKFVASYTVNDDVGTSYAEGDKVKMSESSAAHFVNRGVAEKV